MGFGSMHSFPARNRIVTTAQMAACDAAAMHAGMSGQRLMHAAGFGLACTVARHVEKGPVAVACGPGNNGGDGFVAARVLARWGWPVRLGLLGDPRTLSGDARDAATAWHMAGGRTRSLGLDLIDGLSATRGVLIDAMFGAGLTRPLVGVPADIVTASLERGLRVIAADVPSGVDGDTGNALDGRAPSCIATATFCRLKPAHVLDPGRHLCGEIDLIDIGIPDPVVAAVTEGAPETWLNDAAFVAWPHPGPADHKYRRGHVLVCAGNELTGAARLAAEAARRGGAGLVTLGARDPETADLLRTGAPGTMVRRIDPDALGGTAADIRATTLAVGPGLGRDRSAARTVQATIATGLGTVVDGDALSLFADDPSVLFEMCHDRVVLTPHEGEFARLFGDPPGSRIDRARDAARRAGAAVVLKGPSTTIADPAGRAAVTIAGGGNLATAGTGDVLSGMIAAAMAQGLAPFAAACAAARLHGEIGDRFGRGLIAEDLIAGIAPALASGP